MSLATVVVCGFAVIVCLGHPPSLPWVVLAVVAATIVLWIMQPTHTAPRDVAADEAAELVARLTQLTHDHLGTLDPTIVADEALDELRPRDGYRAAVLVGPRAGHAVPLSLRGAGRVPWAQPAADPNGLIGSAWYDGTTSYGYVGGRALVAVPIRDSYDQQVGILVVDREAEIGPDPLEVSRVAAAAAHHGPRLAVALAYAGLREDAGLQERRELARLLHDGVAQEVAALGFQMDLVRFAAQEAGETSAPALAALRTEVARILEDLRSHIGDLRVGLRPEAGLGAAITTRLQQFGTTTGASVRVSLSEGGFRLPAPTEARLYRVLLDVLGDAHRHGARTVEVELSVSAPEFSLRIGHDGSDSTLRRSRLTERLDGDEVQLQIDRTPGAMTVSVARQAPRSQRTARLRVAS